MSTTRYEIHLQEDAEVVLDRVQQAAKRAGATFEGDAASGHFSGAGVRGEYLVSDEKITVTIVEKPAAISWAVVESMLESFFGQKPVRVIVAQQAKAKGEASDAKSTAEPTDAAGTPASRRSAADKVITEHVLWSIGAGLVPIPFFDLAAVTALQIGLLKGLSKIYAVDHDERSGKYFVTALTGSSLAKLGASAIKALPGIGTLLGGVSMSVMSGASTYALGQVAVQQLESKGSFADLDLRQAKKHYDSAFEEGKTVVADLEKKRAQPETDPVERLRKLKSLLDAGLITQEEHDEQRARILEAI